MIEKMYSGIVGYTISDDNSFSLRVELGMRDPVDGDILQKSVDEIGQRFSYLKQRLACNATDVYYETTDRDFVLKKTNQPIRLNSAESNGNLLAFSYDDQHIYIDAFHGQLDGIGFLILTKALLYNYCLKKYGEPLHVDDVIKVEDPVEPEEIHDPWYELLKTYKPAKLTKVG